LQKKLCRKELGRKEVGGKRSGERALGGKRFGRKEVWEERGLDEKKSWRTELGARDQRVGSSQPDSDPPP
jgi:hypothetical protein